MKRWIVGGAVFAVAVVGVVPEIEPLAVHAVDPVVITVNSTADRDDAALDGVCQTSVAGECTLRAALTEANSVTASPVTIRFAIPGSGVKRIAVGTRLPLIDNGSAGITIDGFTQPGSSPNTDPLIDNGVRLIEITGTGPNGIDGLIMLGSNNVLRGVSVHGFKRAIRMTGKNAQFNIVEGNLIGLTPDGSFDAGYTQVIGSPCIDINSGASRNHIGLPGNANRNVISGCFEKGVTFYNEFTWKNYIQNNLIGLDPTGVHQRANRSMGIDVNWSANGNIIGGTAFQERNVISGNSNSGVEISHGTGTINNQVIGNYIGTDPSGNSASLETQNHDLGVRLEGKPNCGTSACPLDESKEVVTDNVIVNSGWGGIMIDKGTHDSTVARNLIGVTPNGTVISNGSFGIRIAAGSTHNTIGPSNTIAGRQPGIQVNPLGFDPASNVPSPTQDNIITRNSIVSTSGLGIDILPYGTVNQNNNGDPNVQRAINVPVLSDAGGGAVTATACAGCTVELFSTTGALGAFGPGVTWLASAVTDSSGVATFAAPAAGWPGDLTATATLPAGSTSEFAANMRPSTTSSTTTTAASTTTTAASTTTTAPATTTTLPSTTTTTTAPSTTTTIASSGLAVTSLVPRVLGQGASWREVKINGSGFATGATLSFSGTGVVVKSLVVTSNVVLTAKLSVDLTAAVGTRDVTVSNPDGTSGSCAGCFTVSAAPVVTSVSPSSLARGATNAVLDIFGSGFVSGAKVSFAGTGVTVASVTRVDATHLRATVSVASTATTGAHSITVINPDQGTATGSGITVT
jgi:CSLREA domain-containing protein